MNESPATNESSLDNPVLAGIRRLAESENLSPQEALHAVVANGLEQLEAMGADELRQALDEADFTQVDEALAQIGAEDSSRA
jgi:hypothetical protein